MNAAPMRIASTTGMLAGVCLGNAPRIVTAFLPLAEERKGVIRPLYELAASLCAHGWQTMIFDYFGTGDSPGNFADITWRTLNSDCDAAITAMQERGAEEIVILGVRLGARLALEHACRNPETISRIILWEPVLNGEHWLRQLQRRSHFRRNTAAEDEITGLNDVDGYLFSSALSRDLGATASDPERPQCPVHIFCVGNGNQPPAGMAKLGEALGTEPENITMQPFWLQTGVVDASLLITRTIDCLLPRSENSVCRADH